jgi:hypothetical protein
MKLPQSRLRDKIDETLKSYPCSPAGRDPRYATTPIGGISTALQQAAGNSNLNNFIHVFFQFCHNHQTETGSGSFMEFLAIK